MLPAINVTTTLVITVANVLAAALATTFGSRFNGAVAQQRRDVGFAPAKRNKRRKRITRAAARQDFAAKRPPRFSVEHTVFLEARIRITR
jgi:hypothetical protein